MYYTLQNGFPNKNKKDFCIEQTFYQEKMKKNTEKMHFRYGNRSISRSSIKLKPNVDELV